MRETKSDAARREAAEPVRGPLVALGLIGALLCGLALIFVRFAHWAGAHPCLAGLLALVVVPVLYTLLRAMPRTRELRRAARAGMAQADRELAEAERELARTAPAGSALASSGTGTARTVEFAGVAGAAAPVEEPTLPFAPDPDRAAQDGLTAVLPPPAPDFAALDPYGFEAAVAALCERDGCRDVEVVGGAGDLGADVLATAPDGRRVVVQCKQYGPGHKVGSQDLQRFGGTCWTVHGAQLAAVVTTSEFTAPAEEYAAACGIQCVDGATLDAWARGAGPAPWGPAMVDTV